MSTEKDKDVKIGYTTGACAAAAAQAATYLLLRGKSPKKAKIRLPNGETAILPVIASKLKSEFASCTAVKGANGDNDITQGLRISAKVKFVAESITVEGGAGVGQVTLPGLALAVGEAAINPVPKRMIINEAAKILKQYKIDKGLKIIIEADNGQELAKRTFNPKLGIIGGLSILGTTGIVRPMSDESWRRSLLPQIDLAKAAGFDRLVLTFGNLGEQAALRYGFEQRQIIQMSNFVGYMLRACLKKGIKEVLVLGHLGKMIKVADGHFNTHSRKARQKLDLLIKLANDERLPSAIQAELVKSTSAEAAIKILKKARATAVFNLAASLAAEQANHFILRRLPVATAVTDLSGEIIGRSAGADSILTASDWGKT